MTNILLVCSAGISASMTVKKMQGVTVEKKIEAGIWAVGGTDAVNNIEKMGAMPLGPQVRFLKSKTKVIVGGRSVTVINMQVYGTISGAKVLEQALKLLGI